MKRLVLPLLLAGVALGLVAYARWSFSGEGEVRLRLAAIKHGRFYRIGETIPIHLAFSSRVQGRFRINEAHYDRSGRMEFEHFHMTPAGGAVDPMANLNPGSMGGLTGVSFLTRQPWTIDLDLNEWVRFTKPGIYKLTVSSERVEVADTSAPGGSAPVALRSNEIFLRIVAADSAWQKRTYRNAVAALNSPNSNDERADIKAREKAFATLRFLGTPEATRELAQRLRGEARGGTDFTCYIGLVTSPERAEARAALGDALSDPDHPIGETFLNALSKTRSADDTTGTEYADRKRALESLVGALPKKRGKGFTISLSTALFGAWNSKALPQGTVDGLVSQMLARFDELPTSEQESLLGSRWDKIRSPALLPLLRRCVEASDSGRLAAIALKRWYELDPAGARPFVMEEIVRPEPRFGAGELGMLSDETLPEVDQILVDHFQAEPSDNLASLIARYSSPAMLPQILPLVDSRIGKGSCAVMASLLAYVLRVDSETGRPRIERAIAARGPDDTGCAERTLSDVAAIHPAPVLEEIALRLLDDPDPRFAVEAAGLLRNDGSAGAEPVLRQRFEKWSQQWSGHEREMDLAFFENQQDRIEQLLLGRALVEALIKGQNWLADKPKLERLQTCSAVKEIQLQLTSGIRYWDAAGVRLLVQPSADRFWGTVAQYASDDLGKFKSKLEQFPASTHFVLTVSGTDNVGTREAVREIELFLASRDMSYIESGLDD